MEKKKRYSTTNDRTEYSQKKINLPTEPKNDGATNLKLYLGKEKDAKNRHKWNSIGDERLHPA